jgi:deoxyribonuclease IV
MQVFSRSPQRWREKPAEIADLKEFSRHREDTGISPVFIHVPYLINLASPNPRLYRASIEAYIEDVQEAEAMGAEYIVTHMGSHKDTTEKGGLKRLARAINKIIEKTAKSPVGILLENTAGSGSWLGYTFSHHRKVLADLKDVSRVGVCVDTAHAYLAGFDLATREGLERMLGEIEKNVGVQRVKLVHLNDAQGRLGSHLDRHAHIGKGSIGEAGIAGIINHPALRDIPFILETPKDSEDADQQNLALVRSLRNSA